MLDFGLVLGAEFFPQRGELLVHGVQQALLLRQSRFACGFARATAVAEQALEDGARVVFHRQRLCRAAPRDRVRVSATENPGAGTRVRRRIHREIEGSDLCFAGEVTCQQLIHRHVGQNLHFVSAAARRASQEGS
jgi:hypothetical protein